MTAVMQDRDGQSRGEGLQKERKKLGGKRGRGMKDVKKDWGGVLNV